MKRNIVIIACILICIYLGGCMKKENRISRWIGSEQEMSDQIMEYIAATLDDKDESSLKKMFSKPAIEESVDLDSHIQKLMEFYEGTMKNYKGNASSSTHTKYGKDIEKEFSGDYELITNVKTYRVAYEYKLIDDENPEAIGLSKLELVTDTRYQEEVDANGYYTWLYGTGGPGVYMQE